MLQWFKMSVSTCVCASCKQWFGTSLFIDNDPVPVSDFMLRRTLMIPVNFIHRLCNYWLFDRRTFKPDGSERP